MHYHFYPGWNPKKVLGLPNPEKNDQVTCVGATLKRQRCRNPIACYRIEHAEGILERFGSASKSAASLAELRPAAELLLCFRHGTGPKSTGDQSPDILRQWKRKLVDDYGDDNLSLTSGKKASTGSRGVKREPRVKTEDTEEYSRESFLQSMPWYSGGSRRRGTERVKREESDSQSQEQKRRREQKEREERQRQEEENKREVERQQERARAKAFRERVRLERERIERETRAKAQKEAAEWQTAWECYRDGWTKGTDLSVADIAWPVKSGLQLDVNEANVKLFFEKAPPDDLVNSGANRLKLINAENKRWHTDKMMQRFGPDVVNGAANTSLAIVAKVMVVLRQEAQKNRRTDK
ncbi:hypothetical protein GGR53DRAFT_274884 [Hypoxylon sp. FL1150]|nr:hypothetical protein GGR53DRAFT_274884 [Hypoxylon sp. FL1150]